MKKAISFKLGDKVFAKVKGYPPWPACIQSENGKKYNVKFYGTGEIGTIKAEDLFYFIKHKKSLLKVLKRKDYNDGIAEIEAAIIKDGGDGDSNADDLNNSAINTSVADESIKLNESVTKKGKRKRSGSDTSSVESKSKKSNVSAENTPTRSTRRKASEDKDKKEDESTEAEEKSTDEKTDKNEDSTMEEETKSIEETTEENKEKNDEDVEMIEMVDEEPKKDESEKEESKIESPKKDSPKKESPKKSSPVKSPLKKNSPKKASKMEETDESNKEKSNKEDKEESGKEDTSKKNDDEVEEVIEQTKKPENTRTEKVSEPLQEEFNISNFILTTEKSLKNNILYAEHAKKEEKYYSEQPVDQPLIKYEKTVLPVKLTTGKFAGIKLTQIPQPEKFKFELERANFDKALSEAVLQKFEEISKLDKAPVEDYIIPDLNITEEQINDIVNEQEVNLKQERLTLLKDEAKLVVLEKDIKLTLGLDTADPEKALIYLEDMLKLKHVDRIMLLKHYHVLEMVKRLKVYYGNVKEWNLSDESLEKFQKDAEKVRKKADEVFKMLMKLFPELPEKDFWEGFTDTATKFRDECKDLSDAQIGVLWAPPKSRRTYMDLLEEQSVTESENAQNENSKETEKENSSEIANSEKVIDISENEQEVA